MIAIDIGNTNINIAWFKGEKIIKKSKLPTKQATKLKLKKILSKNEKIVICSVVPKVLSLFKGLGNVHLMGKNIKVPIKCFYESKSVGMDRLVSAYAAKKIWPETRFIIDFGTATTIDFLNKKGDYQGGIILAGIGSTCKALSECALLPNKTKLNYTKTIIPKDTQESITIGIVEGFSSMINGLIKKYRSKLKIRGKQTIVITGGEAGIVENKLQFVYKYEPDLVLKGLQMLSVV